MDKLFIPGSPDTAEITLDASLGVFEISGKSLPEDAIVYFTPVDRYLEEYVKQPAQVTTVNMHLTYLNSSSAKKLVDLVTQLETIAAKGYKVEVNWYYGEDDEEMLEEGQEFARLTSLPVNLEIES